MTETIPRTNVLGVGVSALTRATALSTIDDCITRGDHQYVCVAASHGVLQCRGDEQLRRIYNGSLMTTPDGMPLVWLSRIQGRPSVQRVYGPDLMLAVCEQSLTRGYRHFLYGFEIDDEDVPMVLAEALRKRFPGLQIAGTYAAPQRRLTSEEDNKVCELIDESGADIVWVGLGTPLQERWAAAHVGRIRASLLIGVGAAFDFNSGRKPQAPIWMRRVGLEWLFRLLTEPTRLWRRYLFGNAAFVVLTAGQLLGVRSYRLGDADSSSSIEEHPVRLPAPMPAPVTRQEQRPPFRR